jgi:hypothetical protein
MEEPGFEFRTLLAWFELVVKAGLRGWVALKTQRFKIQALALGIILSCRCLHYNASVAFDREGNRGTAE